MTVKALIAELSKLNPDAYIAISDPSRGDDYDLGIRNIKTELQNDPVRLNQMRGWGEDRIYSGYVFIQTGDEMVVLTP